MANETDKDNYITVAAYVDSQIGPYFRAAAIMPNLMSAREFQSGSDSIKLRKAGSATAAVVNEATDATVSEYAETTPATLTAKKVCVLHEVTEEAVIFSRADMDALAREQAAAIATKFDADAMGLFDGFSTSAGTTGVDVTINVMQQAAYKVRLANVPGPLVYVLHPTAVFDLQGAIVTSSASVWTLSSEISLLNGQPQANGFVGKFFNIDVFESTNTESINTNNDWGCACFNPQYALAAGYYGTFRTEIAPKNIQKATTMIKTTLYYDIKEWNDAAGCLILADQ